VFNLFLIPSYGGVGAAIATVISYAASGFFFHGIHPKTKKIFYIQLQSLKLF
jgi:polysaccharide transporter, PST family